MKGKVMRELFKIGLRRNMDLEAKQRATPQTMTVIIILVVGNGGWLRHGADDTL